MSSAARRRFVLLPLLLVGLCGCRSNRILVVGDSIVYGLMPRGARDAQGGFPGRAEKQLCSSLFTYARVINRGISGSTTAAWLAPVSGPDGGRIWRRSRREHPDFPALFPEDRNLSAFEAILRAHRPVDAAIVVLGVNDLYAHRQQPEHVLERLAELKARGERAGTRVWISTIVPTKGSDWLEARVTELNAMIRDRFDDDMLLGDAFRAAAGWPSKLRDSLHPTEEGFVLLADALVEELKQRGAVGIRSRWARSG